MCSWTGPAFWQCKCTSGSVCVCVLPVCSDGSEEQWDIQQHRPDCDLLPGLYASSSPSLLRSLLTLCPPWPTAELSRHYPHPTDPLPSPCAGRNLHPKRLLFSCPALPPSPPPPPRHLSWARHPELRLFNSRLCTATLSSRPLPAARLLIEIGGEERIAVRHGRPLEPTEPGQGHSHHSSCYRCPQQTLGEKGRQEARDAGVTGKER